MIICRLEKNAANPGCSGSIKECRMYGDVVIYPVESTGLFLIFPDVTQFNIIPDGEGLNPEKKPAASLNPLSADILKG